MKSLQPIMVPLKEAGAALDRALGWLVTQPKTEHAFVVVEDAVAARFVQFAGDDTGWLIIDTGYQPLQEPHRYLNHRCDDVADARARGLAVLFEGHGLSESGQVIIRCNADSEPE